MIKLKTKRGKVESYGLEEQVLDLYKEGEGWSYAKIANYFNTLYPDTKKWYAMDIKRFIERHRRDVMERKYQNGENIVQQFNDELSEKLATLMNKLEEKQKKYDELWEEAFDNKDIRTIIQLRKGEREDYEQIRKLAVSIWQYYNANVAPMTQLNQKNEMKINNLIINLGRDFQEMLCPVCYAKMQKYIYDVANSVNK